MYATSFKFDSVVVIESLPAEELRSGRELLETTLAPVSVADPGFVSELYEPMSGSMFMKTLEAIEQNARRYGRSPIIHIETHGDHTGIGLANGDLIPWSEAASALAAINQLARVNLLVVAAMCHGWHMIDILRPTDRAPAFGIIGSRDEMSAGDLLTRMQLFYRALLRPGHDLRAALNEANAAGSIPGWELEMIGAEVMLCNIFSHYVQTLSVEEAPSQRVDRLVAEFARLQNLDKVQTMKVRASISKALDNHEAWFALYRSRFLMLDLYPDNATRFPLTYADCGGGAAGL